MLAKQVLSQLSYTPTRCNQYTPDHTGGWRSPCPFILTHCELDYAAIVIAVALNSDLILSFVCHTLWDLAEGTQCAHPSPIRDSPVHPSSEIFPSRDFPAVDV